MPTCAWWKTPRGPRLLVPTWYEEEQRLRLAVIDPYACKLVQEWNVDGNVDGLLPLVGEGLYYASVCRGRLLRAQPAKRRLVTLAENPVAVQCQCLAISPQRVLAVDSYDCGHAFALDLKTGEREDHGKVWQDDHRCNYGPAAFAGSGGRYFLANHGEGMPALWVTDTKTDRHWKVGPAAIQLVMMSDGTVWGATGPNPAGYRFSLQRCWTPQWQARSGTVFRYRPGQQQVDLIPALPQAGPIVEAPGKPGLVLAARHAELCAYDPQADRIVATVPLAGKALAAAAGTTRAVAYLVLSGPELWACRRQGEGWELSRVVDDFGPTDRGFFVLPESRRVVGIAADGLVTVYDPRTRQLSRIPGPAPQPAGPAVDPEEDAWYYAHKQVYRYALTGGTSGGD